jgi:hypothetical protein
MHLGFSGDLPALVCAARSRESPYNKRPRSISQELSRLELSFSLASAQLANVQALDSRLVAAVLNGLQSRVLTLRLLVGDPRGKPPLAKALASMEGTLRLWSEMLACEAFEDQEKQTTMSVERRLSTLTDQLETAEEHRIMLIRWNPEIAVLVTEGLRREAALLLTQVAEGGSDTMNEAMMGVARRVKEFARAVRNRVAEGTLVTSPPQAKAHQQGT